MYSAQYNAGNVAGDQEKSLFRINKGVRNFSFDTHASSEPEIAQVPREIEKKIEQLTEQNLLKQEQFKKEIVNHKINNNNNFSTWNYESSKYEGEPIIEPRCPYYVEELIRAPDADAKFLTRLKQKIGFISQDFQLYIGDLIKGNSDAFLFKTSYFLKRNYWFIHHKTAHIIEELVKVGQGFRRFKQDIGFFVSHQQEKMGSKYEKVTYKKQIKARQVQQDFIKFIPFSLFIIVPGLEILLPAWVMIFPNSIPSQFQSQNERQKQFRLLNERRNLAAQKLLYILPKYLYALEKDRSVDEQDLHDIKRLKAVLRQDEKLPTDILQFRLLFKKYATFKSFDLQTLIHIAQFMSVTPITGFNTINNLLSMFRLKIPIDAPVIRIIAKLILTRQLNLYFDKLRKEDELMSFEVIDQFLEEELNMVCFKRGINISSDLNRSSKMKDLKLWLAISNLRNIPHSILLYSRIIDFTENVFEISDDEDEYEVLRMGHDEIYYMEKLRVFEKAFGIDQLQGLVKKLLTKRSSHSYNPQEGKFIFSSHDLELYMSLLDEFKTRHSTMADRIQYTYNIGNEMGNYLEKQMIIDFHLKGEQNVLEEEFPELVEKAKKFLGFELYFELTKFTGEPIQETNVLYAVLMQKSAELNEQFQKEIDQLLKQHKDQEGSTTFIKKSSSSN